MPHLRPGAMHKGSAVLCASLFGMAAATNTCAVPVAFAQQLRRSRLPSISGRSALTRFPASTLRPSRHVQSASGLPRRQESNGLVGVAVTTSRAKASSSSPDTTTEEEIVTVRGETQTEETIKKSRFIGRCGPAATFEDGKAILQRVLREHPKARHSCWAWKGKGDEHRFSDDGEPGGTAGQPILAGIEGEGLSNVMVVVTRYFGGIKLGTGGLCRAYGGASRLCLQAAERETRVPIAKLSIRAPFDSIGAVYHSVHDCQRLAEEFEADGSVLLTVAVEIPHLEDVRRRLQDATKGLAQIEQKE